MTELLSAITAFIISHAIPALPPLRAYLIRAMGFTMYVSLYSMISLAVLVWLGLAYAEAPYVEVWEFREWTRWLTLSLMVPSCYLLVAGLLSPNPLSLSLLPATAYDPARPGIVGFMRHPVIWAVGLWALAHLAPNGDLASLLLFSLLLLAGLTGPRSLDAKRRAKLGVQQWGELAQAKASLKDLSVSHVAGGVALYAALFMAHEWIIGVTPLP
jgi:uncharacterized membrane protein